MSQSLSQIWVHIVFSTKDRYPFLKEVSIQERLHQYIKALCNELGCNVAAIGGVEDELKKILIRHGVNYDERYLFV